MNPTLALPSFLPGAMGVLDAPREALFGALGADDGSGAALLEALIGLDRQSNIGRLGGFAAETVLDPMNLVGLGAAKAGMKGVGMAGDMLKARKVAEAEKDIAAVKRLGDAPMLAEEVFNPSTMGPGNLPIGSTADLLPETVGTTNKAIEGFRATGGNPLYPTHMEGGDAARFLGASREQLRRGMGEMYDPEMLNDYREGVLRHNMRTNDATRAAEFGNAGYPAVTTWQALGDEAPGISQRLSGMPEFAGGIPNDPSKIGDLTSTLTRLQGQLASRQAAPAVSPLIEQLLMMGAGGALGGAAGSRYSEL